MSADPIADFKEGNRATWAAGDFPAVAELIAGVGQAIVERTAPREGEEVLDVGCGAGNATIPAARTGARVTGLDLTPELLEAGRRAAAEQGVEIDWVEGDAEAMPFEDESFDLVVSTFGQMFAPRHDRAAAEIDRVLRPGGRIGLCNWRPDGRIGEFFRTIGSYMPPPPDFALPPPMWGDREHVRELFAGSPIELGFEDAAATFRFDSAEAGVRMYEEKFGPLVMAKAALEPEGRWESLRADLIDLFDRHGAQDDGSIAYTGEYLVVLGTKPG